jgi:hypothetical protein
VREEALAREGAGGRVERRLGQGGALRGGKGQTGQVGRQELRGVGDYKGRTGGHRVEEEELDRDDHHRGGDVGVCLKGGTCRDESWRGHLDC